MLDSREVYDVWDEAYNTGFKYGFDDGKENGLEIGFEDGFNHCIHKLRRYLSNKSDSLEEEMREFFNNLYEEEEE